MQMVATTADANPHLAKKTAVQAANAQTPPAALEVTTTALVKVPAVKHLGILAPDKKTYPGGIMPIEPPAFLITYHLDMCIN